MATSRIGIGAPTSRLTATATPHGVDLDLDKFNLSTADKDATWANKVVVADGKCPVSGREFWATLESQASMFSDDSQDLLKAVFDSSLCDRKGEGELFMPPPTTSADKLRALVEAEANVRQNRKSFFLSPAFSPEGGNFGSGIFPSSWKPTVELSKAWRNEKQSLKPRTELQGQTAMLTELIADAEPTFNKFTEDGLRWLIYRFGALEIRAIQEPGRNLEIGAVFSTIGTGNDKFSNISSQDVKHSEKIASVKMCIEKAPGTCKLQSQYFVVATTETGKRVLVEKRGDGTLNWVDEPKNVDDRIAVAKMVEYHSTCTRGATIAHMRLHFSKDQAETENTVAVKSSSKSKRLAYAVYSAATGLMVFAGCSTTFYPQPLTAALQQVAPGVDSLLKRQSAGHIVS